MVTTNNKIPVSRDRKATLFAFAPAVLTAAAPGYLPIDSGLVMPMLGLLALTVVFGLAVLWRHAETERQIFSAQLPGAGRIQAAPLILRPPVRAEGPASLLRDLARTAGEQDGVGTGASTVFGPRLALVPQVLSACFPEPSLLPSMRRPSVEEAGRVRLVLEAVSYTHLTLPTTERV